MLIQPAGDLRKLSGSAEQTTSNRMEMTAVLMALRELSSSGVPVVVRSDSELVIKTLLGRYGRHRNRDLWTQIDRERSRLRLRSIRFEWVKGHAGERYNEIADQLANDAAGIPEGSPRPKSGGSSGASDRRRNERAGGNRAGLRCNVCRLAMRPIEPHDPSRATGQAWFCCDGCGQSGYKDRRGAYYIPALKLTAGESPCDPQIVHQISELRDLFAGFFVSLPKSADAFKRVSAFGIYNIECVHLLRRATIESLACYYGVGHLLLRSALESLIRGAFWECIAHATFRGTAERVRRGPGVNINGKNRTVLDWFKDVIANHSETEQTFEMISASIFDRTSPLFSERLLSRAVPNLRLMVDQIADWGMLKPMEEPVASLYGFLYWRLSDDAHLIPDKTLIGRRFASGKSMDPPVESIAEELESFSGALSCVVDIGLLLSLNVAVGVLDADNLDRESLRSHAASIQRLLPTMFSVRRFQSF